MAARIDLMLVDRDVGEDPSAETRFGGLPSVPDGFAWPECRSCGGAMQFLGQVRVPGADRLFLVFLCQNDSGVCSEWKADSGANAALPVAPDGLRLGTAPAEGDTVRPTRYGARIEPAEAAGYDAARGAWGRAHPGRQREVLGQMGGQPHWLQGDETPSCGDCGQPMRLVAQLEEGPDHATGMNFGGGCGYLFGCGCAGGGAKFLWQN